MNISGKWQGTLIYGEGYDEKDIGKTLDFEFDIIDNDGEVTATGKDLKGHGFNPTGSYMSGFFDDGIISFIKQYHKGLVFDETGKDEFLSGEQNYEINYNGLYNSVTNQFEGDWEIAMLFESKEDPDEKFIEICLGTWTMHKV